MELIEDGNLVDKVNILIQKDMEYYKASKRKQIETKLKAETPRTRCRTNSRFSKNRFASEWSAVSWISRGPRLLPQSN